MQDGPAYQKFLGLSLADPPTKKLAEFFQAKGLAALKQEDQREQWYEDWLAFQTEHRIYAAVLSPKQYSTLGNEFDLLRYARFLEAFAYFSPAHGYSLQVSFLGLFAILMGSNEELKAEAVAQLEKGGLLAFGVSEKSHGSDLLCNEFKVSQISPGKLVANGSKYYIGNSNVASMISILAKREDDGASASSKRMPFVLFALRPRGSKGFRDVRKIRTLGVRAGYVGEFEVEDHELPQSDIIAESRAAWDAVLGTVTLGKFFLGFGSIGMCEHALPEALDHLNKRNLYGKPAIEMPHLRSLMAQAYARLTAMKLYAYRALDYVRAASATDRRYMLFCAVQKAKVSTEGVRVMAQLSECIGAKGFESDTYFEMALRDVQLIPGLEGSTHINLLLAAQFIRSYFARANVNATSPKSLLSGEAETGENPYLMQARTGGINRIEFAHFLDAYEPLMSIPNVRLFAKQTKAFRLFIQQRGLRRLREADAESGIALGRFLALIVYGQLVAENSVKLQVPAQMVSAIFELLVLDLSQLAMTFASSPPLASLDRLLIRRLIAVPRGAGADWDFVVQQMTSPASEGA